MVAWRYWDGAKIFRSSASPSLRLDAPTVYDSVNSSFRLLKLMDVDRKYVSRFGT